MENGYVYLHVLTKFKIHLHKQTFVELNWIELNKINYIPKLLFFMYSFIYENILG